MGFWEYTVVVVDDRNNETDWFELKADTTDAVQGSWILSDTTFYRVVESVKQKDVRGDDSPPRAATTLFVREATPPDFILKKYGLTAAPTRRRPINNVFPLPGTESPRTLAEREADVVPIEEKRVRAVTGQQFGSFSLVRTAQFHGGGVPNLLLDVEPAPTAADNIFVIDSTPHDRPTLRVLWAGESVALVDQQSDLPCPGSFPAPTIPELMAPLVHPSQALVVATPPPVAPTRRRWLAVAIVAAALMGSLALLRSRHEPAIVVPVVPPHRAVVQNPVVVPPAAELPPPAPPVAVQPARRPASHHHRAVKSHPPEQDDAELEEGVFDVQEGR